MKKEISKKIAKEKYGILVRSWHDYKYYLLDNGNVIDSAGDLRYLSKQEYDREQEELLAKK